MENNTLKEYLETLELQLKTIKRSLESICTIKNKCSDDDYPLQLFCDQFLAKELDRLGLTIETLKIFFDVVLLSIDQRQSDTWKKMSIDEKKNWMIKRADEMMIKQYQEMSSLY